MICSKCNSQIADGSKFCTVCGAACGTSADVKPITAPAAPRNKCFCTKCGLELQRGAKFCTSCGAPANVKDIAPLENDGKTFGSGDMSAVSLSKRPEQAPAASGVPGVVPEQTPYTAPASVLQDQASASVIPEQPAAPAMPAPSAPRPTMFMHSGAPGAAAPTMPASAAAPVPTMPASAVAPAPTVPTPAAAPAPTVPTPAAAPTATVPTPSSASGYNSGFSTPTTGNPEMPPFSPSSGANGSAPSYGASPAYGSNPAYGSDVNGLNGAAAASVAVPGKKKASGAKIALIIAIVLVVLVGAAAIFFFTNKATALSIVMGKPKYAAMVEKESIEKTVEKIDMDVVSEQIKTVSSVMPMLASRNDISSFMSNKSSEDAQFAKLMAASSASGVDISSMIKDYSEYMQSMLGASRISGSMTMDIELGDMLGDVDDANKMLQYINGSQITYDMAATSDMIGGEFGLTLNSKPVNAKAIVQSDGTMYISFPFASSKVLKVKIPTNELTRSAGIAGGAALELDPDELERLMNELIEIYSGYIKDSSVSMEKGSLTVAGSVVEGKLITADINGTNLANLMREVLDKITNDQYFCTQITNYVKSFDPSFTESQYKSMFTGLIPDTLDGNLIINTIVKNNGDVLAKSYKLATNGMVVMEMAFSNNDSENNFEIKAKDQTFLTAKTTKTSDTDGSTAITFGLGNGKSVGVVLTYSNVGEATFGKTEIATGTYGLKFDMSNADASAIGSSNAFDVLRAFSMDYTISVDNGTEKVSMKVNAGDVGKFEFNTETTLSDDTSAYSAPSNAIDVTDLMTSGNADENTINQLNELSQEFTTAINDVIAGTELEEILNDALSGSINGGGNSGENGGNTGSEIPSTPPTNETRDDLEDLENSVFAELMEVYDWFSDNSVYTGTAYDNAVKYQDSLRDLDERIIDAYGNCTPEQLEKFQIELKNLLKKKNSLKKAVQKAGAGNSGTSSAASSGAASATSKPSASGSGSMTSQKPAASSSKKPAASSSKKPAASASAA